jgi:hypothetical protein
MSLMPPCPYRLALDRLRTSCNFIVPPVIPYKYSVGTIVMDDKLMAIYS